MIASNEPMATIRVDEIHLVVPVIISKADPKVSDLNGSFHIFNNYLVIIQLTVDVAYQSCFHLNSLLKHEI